MNATQLRELQAPLKTRYRQDPASARVTMRARGHVIQDEIACRVEIARPGADAGLHLAAGGDGTKGCSGELLLEALVGCAGVTLAAVATSMEIGLASAVVSASADLDFRGTLGVARDVPVGFAHIALSFAIESDAPADKVRKAVELAERYCVVLQTLVKSTVVTVDVALTPAPVTARS